MQTLLARLKAETRFQHLRLERHLDVLGDGVTRAGHRRLLRRLYGFHRPWEEQALPLLERGHPGLTAGRSKLGLLERDLLGLGDDLEEIRALPCCRALPPLDTLCSALGSMYVLEGATLGGQVVSRHLARTLGVDADSGASFFRSYGDEVGPMWRRFGEALAVHAGREDDRVVACARDTFVCLHDWLLSSADDPA
ncbi:MAG TPA: biliverdin-producing heme oxygenase [Gemmatimonadales bacterium]|nr:biliverdin-producing heme oxygenase [Gemmatimonadales bacterium]